MNAIPTLYNGVQFRSRLEARWARFFDLAGWRWHYEPVDLNGYIPDFILDIYKPVLVECKPTIYLNALREFSGKIDNSGWKDEAIIVGSVLPLSTDSMTDCFGLLRETGFGWGGAIAFTCLKCEQPSFCHSDGSYACRIKGCYNGNGYHGDTRNIYELFKQAQNDVQWNRTL